MHDPRGERGFTLIELLVVILIIAILAAIAIPVFLRQRIKGWETQTKSSLKNAAIAVETYATENNGDYSGLDELQGCCAVGSAGEVLGRYGFRWADYYTHPSDGWLRIEATSTHFCIAGRHKLLDETSAWRRSTYQSWIGAPQPTPDSCADSPAPPP